MVSTSSTAPLWGWAPTALPKGTRQWSNAWPRNVQMWTTASPWHGRSFDRPGRLSSFVLLPKEDSRPHCGVDPKSNNVIPFKITPPKPWFGIGPDWIQFFFLPKGPKCQFTYCKSITIRAAKGLNDLGYYETQTLWLWLSSPGINRGKGK